MVARRFPNGPLPYKGPGIESVPGIGDGTPSFATLLQALMTQPAGTSAADMKMMVDELNAAVVARGIFATDGFDAGPNTVNGLSFLQSALINPGTVSFYDFSNPLCFPYALNTLQIQAGFSPAQVPEATVLRDLVQIALTSNMITGSVVPAGQTTSTAAPINYGAAVDNNGTAIMFDGTLNGSVMQGINLNASAISYNPPLVPLGTKRALFMIAIETLASAALPSSGAALLAIFGGNALTNTAGAGMPQAAFAVDFNGKFRAYVSGSNQAGISDNALAPSTRYSLAMLYEQDENDPTKYWATLFVNGTGQGFANTSAVPYHVNEPYPSQLLSGYSYYRVPNYVADNQTPWSTIVQPAALGMQTGDGTTVGFGPLPTALGGKSYNFNALGSMVVNLDKTPIDAKLLISMFNSNFYISTSM